MGSSTNVTVRLQTKSLLLQSLLLWLRLLYANTPTAYASSLVLSLHALPIAERQRTESSGASYQIHARPNLRVSAKSRAQSELSTSFDIQFSRQSRL